MEKPYAYRYIRYRDGKSPMMTLWKIITLIVLCLMSMDFQTRFFYFAFSVFLVSLISRHSDFVFPRASIPAFILSISMCIFSPSTKGWFLAVLRPFAYPLCVIAGYNLISVERNRKNEKQFTSIIIALALGAYIHYMLNMIYNLGKSIDRNTIDFWTHSVLAATGQSTLAALMIGTSMPMLFFESRKTYKALFGIILLSILYYNLMLGGRTVLALTLLLFFLNVLSVWARNESRNRRIYLVLSLAFIAIATYIIIRFDIFGIQKAFYESNFFARFFSGKQVEDITSDSRIEHKVLYLQNMLHYPFGGNELHNAVGDSYAHDLLLDAYSDSGIFAFFALLIMIISCIFKVFRFYRNTEICSFTKILLINVMITFFTMFLLEPIFDGMPWLFACYCVIYGAISKIDSYVKNEALIGEKTCALLK